MGAEWRFCVVLDLQPTTLKRFTREDYIAAGVTLEKVQIKGADKNTSLSPPPMLPDVPMWVAIRSVKNLPFYRTSIISKMVYFDTTAAIA